MKAVVLCAGLGTRLGALTSNLPKPMLPVCHQPILSYTLQLLREYGFNEVAINLHYLPDKVTEFVKDGRSFGLRVRYSHENQVLGTAGALIPLYDWLSTDDAFLVVYGDVLTDQNLSLLVQRQNQTEGFACLLVHWRKQSNSIVQMDAQGRITYFKERPTQEEQEQYASLSPNGGWVNSGIQMISRKALTSIVTAKLYDLPKDLYARYFRQERIYALPLSGFRIAVDSPERYAQARTTMIHHRGRHVCPCDTGNPATDTKVKVING